MHIQRWVKDVFRRGIEMDLVARDPAKKGANTKRDPKERTPSKNQVITLYSVVYSTAAKTFDGPAIYVTSTPNALQPTIVARPTQPINNGDDGDEPTSTLIRGSSIPKVASSSKVSLPSNLPAVSPSNSLVQPVAPQPTAGPTVPAAAAASTTAAAAAGGMTGGAKAGLAFGIIAILGVAFAAGFIVYRRRQRKNDSHERLDDEKGFMSSSNPDSLPAHAEPTPPQVMAVTTTASAVSTRRTTQESAPRLSLRPLTEFLPNLGGDRRSNVSPPAHGPQMTARDASAGVAAAAAAAAAPQVLTPGSSPKLSAWERPGAAHNASPANDPANPFGNHAETVGNSPPSKDATLLSAAAARTTPPSPPREGCKEINAADFPLPESMPATPRTNNFPESAKSGIPSPTQSEASVPSSLMAAGGAAAVVGGASAVASKSQSPPVGPENNVHRVQLDFKPSMDDELDIRAGQLVRVLHEYDDGWALCIRMDRSQQGVVPRTCLSKHPVKPRPASPGQRPGMPGPRGPPRGPPGGPPPFAQHPRPLSPGGSGRSSPTPGQAPRPLTPNGGRSSPVPHPAPFAQNGGRPRANSSSVSPYRAYNPSGRSMSPGPHGGSGLRPKNPGVQGPQGPSPRRRTQSVSQVSGLRNVQGGGPAGPSKIPAPIGQVPARKPVPGQEQRTSS